jgi:sarcosine oxidase subunit gamma
MADPGLVVTDRGRLTIVQIAAIPGMSGRRVAVEDMLGAALPDVQTASTTSQLALLWTGPKQWWAVTEHRPESSLVRQLEDTAAGEFAVIDLSGSRTVLRLSGSSVRYVLAKGSGVDFHLRSFPTGTSITTALARLSTVIHAIGPTTVDLYVYRSFGRELMEWLLEAGADCTISLDGARGL